MTRDLSTTQHWHAAAVEMTNPLRSIVIPSERSESRDLARAVLPVQYCPCSIDILYSRPICPGLRS
jgi:hypothetical protein